MPFEAKGFACVGLYDEGGDEKFYHSSGDVREIVNQEKLVQATRLVAASLLSICNLTS